MDVVLCVNGDGYDGFWGFWTEHGEQAVGTDNEGWAMVRVITIMDDVYVELNRLKKSKDMSFSEILRFLLKERRDESRNLIKFAGSITELDVDRGSMDRVRRNQMWNR